MMRCCVCKRLIASGVEATKMIVEYRQPDASTILFGLGTPGGPLSGATGQILRGWHSKCFHVVRKREQRGDTVTGRVLAGLPSGYDLAAMVLTREDLESLGLSEDQARERGTAYLTQRLDRLRAIAHRVGKAIGDAAVMEAFRAEEHGGPYPHTHDLQMDHYHLREHLRYAHGIDFDALGLLPLPRHHNELHATARRADAIQAGRATDPGHRAPRETDWRPAVAVDVEQITQGETLC
jgi:hypothetical protein